MSIFSSTFDLGMKRHLFIVCLVMWGCLPVFSKTGQSVYPFLELPTSTLAAGLGGQTVSSPENDLMLGFQSPASIRPEMHKQLSLGFMNYISDTKVGQVAYSQRFKSDRVWMAGVRYFDYGHITSADIYGNQTGETFAKDIALSGAYSFLLAENWRGGISADFIYSAMDVYTSVGLGVNLGVTYSNPDKLLWGGFSVSGLGSQFSAYDETRENLPWDIRLGLTKGLEHAPFRLTATLYGSQLDQTYYNNDENKTETVDKLVTAVMRHVLLGVEILPSDNLLFCVGFNPRRRSDMALEQRDMLTGMSAAFNLKVKKMRIGASFARYHQAGNSLQMTFATSFDK